MQATIQQANPTSGVWNHIHNLNFISTFFNWFFLLLAKIAEPFMSLSVIYIIVQAGIPVLHNPIVFNGSEAALIGAPEVILPGAFVLAARAKAEQQNSTLQYLMCWLFVALTLFTLVSLFVLKLDGPALNILMCTRCAAGVCFSILQRVVNHVSPETPTVSPAVSPVSPPLDYAEIAKHLQPMIEASLHPANPVEIDYETIIQAIVSRVSLPETHIVEVTGEERMIEAPTEQGSIESRIQALLDRDPSLSHRELAALVGCADSTAYRWKKKIRDMAV